MAADGAVTFLLQKIESLITKEWKLLIGIKIEVDGLRDEFEMIRALLKEADSKRESNEQVRVWLKQVRDLAYDIEDILDMYAFHTSQQSSIYPEFLRGKRTRSIATLVQDIKTKLSGVKEIRERYQLIIRNSSQASSSGHENYKHHHPSVASLYTDEADIVGIEEPKNKLMAWAINGESKLNVVFVVGMAGLGKTLVARKVYEGTKESFDCRAWIPISKSQRKEELLWTILKRLFESLHKPIPREFYTISIIQLMDKLRTFLEHRKYLIILDDLWSKDVWESLKYALPNQNHGRVIITTRRGDIADFYRQESTVSVYNLQPLSTEMAQQLFYKSIFPSTGECPSGLLEWSGKLLKQCEGLPLGIISIGNLLSNMEKTGREWRKLHDSLGSEFDSNGRLSSTMNVISASYDDLPYNLKYCLLYFSIFPEDYSIERRKLIRLWISEGLVKQVKGKTPEDVGEDYLKELIQRSLVLVNDVDFDGRPKNCRVHHLLHKIIFTKSQEENFCSVFTDLASYLNEKVRRLSIHQLSCTNTLQMNFAHSRSFFMIGVGELPHSISHQAILSSLSILKVLDLEGAPLEKFPTAIINLILLRYLSLRNTNIRRIPRSISKLQNLEVLDLKQTFVTELPRKIIELVKLRHLLVCSNNLKNCVSIDCVQGFKGFKGIGGLMMLQKLSFINATDDDMLGELEKLSQLRKLGVIGLKEQDGRYLCHSIMKLKNLQSLDLASIHEDEFLDLTAILDPPTLLQRLCLKGRLQNLPTWISSLHDLIRIQLKWSKLDISPIDALQDLPNLMELQLFDAYTGKQLDFCSMKFPNLKILKLEILEDLEQVIMEEGTLAKLEKLIVRKCEKMKGAPKGIERLALLKELHLYDMEDIFLNRIQFNGEVAAHSFHLFIHS